MRRVLRISSLVRKRFDNLPHWIRDLYGIISWFSFVELIPTLAGIALAPRHFFRRLPITLQGKRSRYQTPVKFFFNFATLFLMVFFMRAGGLEEMVSEAQALWYMPLLIPLTPPVMAVAAIVCWLLYQIPRLAPLGDDYPAPNSGPFRMILDPRNYFRLSPARYFWGLFYISVYFIAAWQIAQVAIGLIIVALAYFVTSLGEGHLLVKGLVSLMAVAATAASIHAFVLHPYMEMFRCGMRSPSKAMFQGDVHELKVALQSLIDLPDQKVAAQAIQLTLDEELPKLNRLVSTANFDYQWDDRLRQQRIDIYKDAFQMESLQRVGGEELAESPRQFIARLENDDAAETPQRMAA